MSEKVTLEKILKHDIEITRKGDLLVLDYVSGKELEYLKKNKKAVLDSLRAKAKKEGE